MGVSTITFGDAGGEPPFGNKYLPPKIKKDYPNGQVCCFGRMLQICTYSFENRRVSDAI
jgi:hypothetical protein